MALRRCRRAIMLDEWLYLEVEEPPKCLAEAAQVHHYSELPNPWADCLKYQWRLSFVVDAGEGRKYEWWDRLTDKPVAEDIRRCSYMAWHRMKDKPGVRECIDRIEGEAINA